MGFLAKPIESQHPQIETAYAQPLPDYLKVAPPNQVDQLMHMLQLFSHPGLDANGNRVRSPMVLGDTVNTPPPEVQYQAKPIVLDRKDPYAK